MGIVDSNKFTITCPKCGEIERVAVHEYGSAYSSSWDSAPALSKFGARWSETRAGGPVIESASCRACVVPAIVEGP